MASSSAERISGNDSEESSISSQETGENSDRTGRSSEIRTSDTSASSSASSGSTATTIQREPSVQQQCWVCFATEEDDPDTEWVRPCRCKGSTMWVHQKCLKRWVDEKQRGNTFVAVACATCGSTYTILYPSAGFVVLVLERFERLLSRVCPIITGGVIIISFYWSAVSYGAITVMELSGGVDRGIHVMDKIDPLALLIGLPAIPMALVLFKMIRWEDRVVRWLRDRFVTGQDNSRRLAVPAEGAAAPAANDQAAAQQQILVDAVSATRIICGALALPTIAVLVGKVIYGDSIASPFKRACYGAATYLVVRGATKIYFKYSQIVRQKNLKILDYRPPTNAQNGGARGNGGEEAGAADNIQPDLQP